MPADSRNRLIEVGDTVSYRGAHYIIKEFVPGGGYGRGHRIVFEGTPHTAEPVEEWSVDLIDEISEEEECIG